MSDHLVEESSPRYEFLAQRALEFVRDKHGRASEDDVVRHVFGGNASPKLWSSLLRTALEHEDQLVLQADGIWTIAGEHASPVAEALRDFVALDVETTGLSPFSHRIIEIAALRFRNGVETDRFVTFLQPDRALPSIIIQLTGIRDEDLVEAPHFEELADGLCEFLGDDLIIGHNVGFDINFVTGELKRIGRPPLANTRWDTLAAANRLLVGLRRKNLGKLATYLGIPEGREHRAQDDARRTAEVAFRLIELAVHKGITEEGDLLRVGAPMPRKEKDGNPHRKPGLDRSLLADIPKSPGVYIMSDGFGHVIYIGKAKNLRDRVGSYFSQALGYTRKMDGLLESLVSIHVEETGSELQALLLEAQLIRFYQPRYNTALRASESYPYIRINVSNPWPRVALSKERKDDGSRYFGPYRSRSMAAGAVEAINRVFPLRTCTRSFKNAQSYGKPCIKLDLHQCLGPCMPGVDRGEYRRYVNASIAFLEGDPTAMVGELHRQLERSAERLEFEKARRLRADLTLVLRVAENQRAMAFAVQYHNVLLVQPGATRDARQVLMVLDGRLWACLIHSTEASSRDLALRLAQSYGRSVESPAKPIDHASLDDALILNRWLRQQSGHPAILEFDRADVSLDWNTLAERAMGLSIEDLNTVMPAIERDEDQLEREITNALAQGSVSASNGSTDSHEHLV